MFIGVLGPVMFPRLTKLLGLDPEEFSFDACSRDAAAVNSAKGLEFNQILREYCAGRKALEVETVLNNAQIGCSRVFGVQDRYEDARSPREMTVPVLDRQSGVPVHVYGVVPKLSLTPGQIWRGAPAIGEDTTPDSDNHARLLRRTPRRSTANTSCTEPNPSRTSPG